MKMNSSKKGWGFVTAALLFTVGAYNAVVINSQSDISGDIKFSKRLDEVYGLTVHGREVASHLTWSKISASKIAKISSRVAPEKKGPALTDSTETSEPAVLDELTMNLVEAQGPNVGVVSGFSGTMMTRDGRIESLSVSIPGSETLSISSAELNGNVFEYSINGEQFSGLLYQVDENAYMVTLTNGAWEGTRLRFSSSESAESQQEEVKQALLSSNIEIGSFGLDSSTKSDPVLQAEALQAQGFSLEEAAL